MRHTIRTPTPLKLDAYASNPLTRPPATATAFATGKANPRPCPAVSRHCISTSSALMAAQSHYAHHLSVLSAWSTAAERSPYDVLDHPRTGPYRKSRYYQLVQVYHPDHISATLRKAHRLHSQSCSDAGMENGVRNNGTTSTTAGDASAGYSLSPEEINRRYRLIVAAHEILSDPTRRMVYDRSGHGWHSRTELFGSSSHRAATTGAPNDDAIYRNATWEDWERYRRQQQRQGPGGNRQQHDNWEGEEGVPVPSSVFGSFLIMSCLIIGVIQAVTIGRYSMHEARAREISIANARFLDERKKNSLYPRTYGEGSFPRTSSSSASNGHVVGGMLDGVNGDDGLSMPPSSESQVQSFLRSRDPLLQGLKPEERDAYEGHRLTPASRPRRITHSINDVQAAEDARARAEVPQGH